MQNVNCKKHVLIVVFRRSKTAITIVTTVLFILLSLCGWICQLRNNNQLKDNDLKYRYIKMEGKTNSQDLLRLETIFAYSRSRDSISVFREQVKSLELSDKEQAERTVRTELN